MLLNISEEHGAIFITFNIFPSKFWRADKGISFRLPDKGIRCLGYLPLPVCE